MKACEKLACNVTSVFLLVMKSPEGQINYFSAVYIHTTCFFFNMQKMSNVTHFLKDVFPYFLHTTQKNNLKNGFREA